MTFPANFPLQRSPKELAKILFEWNYFFIKEKSLMKNDIKKMISKIPTFRKSVVYINSMPRSNNKKLFLRNQQFPFFL